MLKARDIIGMPVIDVTSGKQLGSVKDFYLNQHWELKAILLEGKHWFHTAKAIVCEDIISFGQDAITIYSEECVNHIDVDPEWVSFMSGNSKIKGRSMITVNGIQLGLIEDVYFEENKGKKVIGYELTEGFISDLTEGRKWLPAPHNITLGEDAIIVPLQSDLNLEEIETSIRE